jgi:hypothetical protein
MGESETSGGSYRSAIRWGVLLAGLITAAMRAPELHRFWAQWRALAAVDAVAADSYRNYFLVESLITLFVLGMAVTLFYLLAPRQKKAA